MMDERMTVSKVAGAKREQPMPEKILAELFAAPEKAKARLHGAWVAATGLDSVI
jgi:hypothetical protein